MNPGPPHHRPPHHRPPEWIQNEEKMRSLQDIGERLQKIGDLLSQKGNFKLGTTQITPSNPSLFIMRYERMPKGELSLKLEMKWEENEQSFGSTQTEADLPIE